MIIQVHLPDEVATVYERRSKARKITLSKTLAEQLKLFVDVNSHDRVLIVDAFQRNRIERVLSKGGHIKHGGDLAGRVETLARISIEGVDLKFDQSEKAEIARRAEKNGISLEEEVRRTVDGMKFQLFDHLA